MAPWLAHVSELVRPMAKQGDASVLVKAINVLLFFMFSSKKCKACQCKVVPMLLVGAHAGNDPGRMRAALAALHRCAAVAMEVDAHFQVVDDHGVDLVVQGESADGPGLLLIYGRAGAQVEQRVQDHVAEGQHHGALGFLELGTTGALGILEEHLEAGAEVVKEGVVQRVDAFEAFEARRRRARCASSALMPCLPVGEISETEARFSFIRSLLET